MIMYEWLQGVVKYIKASGYIFFCLVLFTAYLKMCKLVQFLHRA